MLNRDYLNLSIVLAAGILFGATAGQISANPGWPIVIGLAAIVIVTLAAHVRSIASATENAEASKVIAARGRSALVSTGMVVCGIALLLGTCAPGGGARGMNFTLWIGWSVLVMGIVLTYAIGTIGRRNLSAEVTLLRGRKD